MADKVLYFKCTLRRVICAFVDVFFMKKCLRNSLESGFYGFEVCVKVQQTPTVLEVIRLFRRYKKPLSCVIEGYVREVWRRQRKDSGIAYNLR